MQIFSSGMEAGLNYPVWFPFYSKFFGKGLMGKRMNFSAIFYFDKMI